MLLAGTLALLVWHSASSAHAGPLPYIPAWWNAAANHSVMNVPEHVLFNASTTTKIYTITRKVPLFPLAEGCGSVQQCCNSRDHPPEVGASGAAACWYQKQPNGQYSYWETTLGARRLRTNCYCYALNISSAYCDPGRSTGVSVSDYRPQPNCGKPDWQCPAFNCSALAKGLIADGARPVSKREALGSPPAKGWYVALLYRGPPQCTSSKCGGEDYHMLRLDSNRLWSHKQGDAAVMNTGAKGAAISDPQKAVLALARFPGADGGGDVVVAPYTDFCGYFQVEPATMKRPVSDFNPYQAQSDKLAAWRKLGLKPSVMDMPAWSDEQARQQALYAQLG